MFSSGEKTGKGYRKTPEDEALFVAFLIISMAPVLDKRLSIFRSTLTSFQSPPTKLPIKLNSDYSAGKCFCSTNGLQPFSPVVSAAAQSREPHIPCACLEVVVVLPRTKAFSSLAHYTEEFCLPDGLQSEEPTRDKPQFIVSLNSSHQPH